MKNIIGFLLYILLISSCSQDDSFNIAYRITEKDLIPEGITYSSTTNSFYLSSILKTKIVQIDAETGKFKDFIPSDLLGMRFLGMIVDENRDHLWACANLSEDNKFYSTVAKFDLKTGELINSFIQNDSIESTFNDLVQDKEGSIYITNTGKQTIYKIDQKTDALSLFFDSDQISHPNGITISPDYKYLYIASTDKGIRILDMETQTLIDEPDSTIISVGLDGIKYYKNSIIGVQNEGIRYIHEMKIVQYFLNETGTKIIKTKIIDQNNPLFEIPTTFVIVGDELFCVANSQMGNVNWTNYKIRSYEALNDTYILKYNLR